MKPIIVTLLALSLVSCKDLFQFSPNEVRLEEHEKNLNQKNIQKIQSMHPRENFRFILIGDSQRFYDEVEDFVASANTLDDIAFVVLAGDITDFGLNKEYRWIADRLNKLKMPYIGVIGNHDMLANGREAYRQMFGQENFSFTYAGTKIVCLNTCSNERGFDGTIPDMPWLTKELSDTLSYENAFVVSHMPPFDAGFDKRMEQSYAQLMSSSKRIRLSLHGHKHTALRTSPYGDGFEYLVTGSMSKRAYYIISVGEKGYHIEERDY
ncbi:MAG TPA: metallophosphoesterase [Chitinophagaceae bacterium]